MYRIVFEFFLEFDLVDLGLSPRSESIFLENLLGDSNDESSFRTLDAEIFMYTPGAGFLKAWLLMAATALPGNALEM